jgi:DNA polymerase-3 subunit epsilon
VHGYTREILERDGESPLDVYREFAAYVGNRPVTAYNLAYDWDDVLLPEWERLGRSTCGSRGLCMMRLTQRLLDPVPAGNCKLQTLRQYFNLPARGAHSALGDVETVIDLAQKVLRPLAEARGLTTLDALLEFSEAAWFPARIPFGKFKGRLFREARTDAALRDWLAWLSASSNARSAQMGRWYIEQLEVESEERDYAADIPTDPLSTETKLVVYSHPDIARLKRLIEAARVRLAELEVTYTRERQMVSVTQARLFELLRPLFQKRDRLKLRLDYRRKYLETLLFSGEEEASTVTEQFEQAKTESDAAYERAAAESAGRKELTSDEEGELKVLWSKLVRLFHPDRYMDDAEKRSAYEHLTAEVNCARDAGDIERLREIADDPQGFMARQGWGRVSLEDSEQHDKLKYLHEALDGRVISLLEALDALHESAEYELHKLASAQPNFLLKVAESQSQDLEEEIKALDGEMQKIDSEINELQS